MSKVKLSFANRKLLYLCSTDVENMFINEYMPAAPGDYVKVYLYALMMVQYGIELDSDEMRHSLGLTEDELYRAWDYWAKLGVVKLTRAEESEKIIIGIEFNNIAEYYYGGRLGRADVIKKEAASSGQYDEGKASDHVWAESPENAESKAEIEEVEEYRHTDDNQERMNRIINEAIRELYNQYEMATGRTVSKKEIQRIAEAIKSYNITPDVMSYAIKYCSEIEKYSIDYIFKVALRWTEEGCRDISQVKENLDKYSKRNANYASVFREMGFTRLPNPSDKAMMDRWFDEMGCSIADVIEACRASAGLREPTLKYVNKVLENKQLESGGIDTRQRTVQNKAIDNSGAKSKSSANGSEEYKTKVSRKVLKDYYEFLRNDAEKIQNAHIDEVCGRIERMRELFELENRLNMEMLSGQLMMSPKDKRDAVRAQRREMENEKKVVLAENGYPEDYLDRKYKCNVCGDTGITDEGRNCVCGRARAEEAYKWYQTIKKN